jgi:ferric-dicitrate binding protein FerR (iron transport regulator)
MLWLMAITRLPTERELKERFSAARMTLQAHIDALGELEATVNRLLPEPPRRVQLRQVPDRRQEERQP